MSVPKFLAGAITTSLICVYCTVLSCPTESRLQHSDIVLTKFNAFVIIVLAVILNYALFRPMAQIGIRKDHVLQLIRQFRVTQHWCCSLLSQLLPERLVFIYAQASSKACEISLSLL